MAPIPPFSVAPAKAGVQGRIRRACPPLGARFRGHDDNCAWVPLSESDYQGCKASAVVLGPRFRGGDAEGRDELRSKIMKVGIALNMLSEPPRPDVAVVSDHLAMGDLAEPLGFDSLFALEHHFTGYAM